MEVKQTSKQNTELTKSEELMQGTGTRRQYTNRSGKSGHISPAIVEKYLAGMHYPAERQKLIDNAQNKEAPGEVMNLLNKLPNKTYKSPIDITKEMGKIG